MPGTSMYLMAQKMAGWGSLDWGSHATQQSALAVARAMPGTCSHYSNQQPLMCTAATAPHYMRKIDMQGT